MWQDAIHCELNLQNHAGAEEREGGGGRWGLEDVEVLIHGFMQRVVKRLSAAGKQVSAETERLPVSAALSNDAH